MKKSHLFTISSFAILALVSCGAKGYTHPSSNELRHYSADLNHDGKIGDFVYEGETIHENNLTWKEAYDRLLDESTDVAALNTFADNMGIAKNETERTNLARYEIMHQAEELLMSTGAVIPLYNYQDPYLLKESVSGLYCSGIGGKFFNKLLRNGKSDGEFKFSIGTKANSFDPAVNDDSSAACLICNCFSGLCKWEKDAEELKDYPRTYNAHIAINTDIVETLEKNVNKDGTATYTFVLKKDDYDQFSKFTSGHDVTAKNFIWAWNRAASAFTGTWTHMYDCIEGYDEWKEKSAKLIDEGKKSWDMNFGDPSDVSTYKGMKGITLVDDQTFKVHLVNDCAYFMDLLAFPTFLPLDYEIINECEKKGDVWWLNPNTFSTNGPLKVAEMKNYEAGGAKLIKWDGYKGTSEAATIKSIYLSFLDSDSAMLDKYNNDALDMIDSISTSQIKTIKATRPNEWRVADQVGIYYFLHNVNDNSFDIKADQSETDRENLRKAFNLLLNRHDYTETIVRSGCTDASGFVSTGIIEKCVPSTKIVSGASDEGDNGIWCKRMDSQTKQEIDNPVLNKETQKANTYPLMTADWHDRSADMYSHWATGDYKNYWLQHRKKGGFYDTVTDTKKSEKDVMENNIQKAIELAKSAGVTYTGDIDTGKFTNFPNVTITTNTGTGHEALCERMQASLDLFGIKFKIETQEWNAFQTTKKRGAFAIARNGWIADFSDPKTYLSICASTSDNNDTQLGKEGFHRSK